MPWIPKFRSLLGSVTAELLQSGFLLLLEKGFGTGARSLDGKELLCWSQPCSPWSTNSILGVGGEERLNRSSVIFQIPAFFYRWQTTFNVIWGKLAEQSVCNPLTQPCTALCGSCWWQQWQWVTPALLLCTCTPVCTFVPLELCHPSSLHNIGVTNPNWGSRESKECLGAGLGWVSVSKTRSRLCSSVPVKYNFICIALVLGCCLTAGDGEEEDGDPTKCCTKSRGSRSPLP